MNHHRYSKTNKESAQTIVTRRHQIEGAVIAWTDGACEPNPGLGGWGVMLEDGGQQMEFCGGQADTTNNRMELQAIVEAVKASPVERPLIVRTDSQLSMLCAVGRWKRKANLDLWAELDAACAGRNRIVYEWWRGHCGTAGNERADRLAAEGRAGVVDDSDRDARSFIRQLALES